MNTPWKLVGALSVAFAISVFSLPAAASNDNEPAVPANPTFTKDVLPILQKSCQICHRPGTPAPMSLLTYEDARPWARSIKSKVVTRYMPPWHLDRTVGEYDPDPSLSDSQIATIARWVDDGAPKGNLADAPMPIQFPDVHAWQFGEEPDLVINAPPVLVPPTGPDMYPQTEVPSGLTEDRYIKWIQVIPGDPKAVHHANVHGLPPTLSESANTTVGTRDGGVEETHETLLSEYARGNDGDIFQDGEGKLLKAGTTIRFAAHYHPNGETATVDHTKVGIKFFPKGYKPKHLILSVPIYSMSLMIPPGDPNARSDAYFHLKQAARIVSFQPHMHYRGKRMALEAIPPSGVPQLLTDVPHFVWTWQITYPYKDPPTFPKGTVLHVTAYHDNSAANKENPDPTAFVSYANRTVDEMNNGWIDFYYISDEEYAVLQNEKAGRSQATTGGNQQ